MTMAKIVSRLIAVSVVMTLSLGSAGEVTTAAVYVVDNQHPKASDENSGTEASPWKTLGHAAATVQAGDTVFVMDGTYDEIVTLSKSGTGDRRIVFKGMPEHAATVQGFRVQGAYLRIEGFKIVPTDPKGPGNPLGCGIHITTGHHVDVVGNYITHAHPAIGGDRRNRSHHVSLVRNEVFKCQKGICVYGENWLVESNEVSRIFQYGRSDSDYGRIFGSNHLVRHNRFHGTRKKEVGRAHLDGFQTFDVHGTFLRNTVFEQNFFSHYTQGFICGASGRKSKAGSTSKITFRRNIYRGFEPGLDGASMLFRGASGVTIENNTFARNKWIGVWIRDKNSNMTIKNNLFFNTRKSYSKIPANDTCGYNLLYQAQALNQTPTDIVSKDLRLADPANDDFRLTKDSPAIDAGEKGVDIGALEYPNVYYVDPRHPGADDEGFGYAGWPFKTAAAALKMAQPGETVVLRGGTYRELIAPKTDGITLRAMESEKVVVSGADLITGWKREASSNWSAPLAVKPVRVLKDGKSFSGFTYDVTEKKILVEGFDPRLRVMETVVRSRGIDLAGKKNVKVTGVAVAHTLGDPQVHGDD